MITAVEIVRVWSEGPLGDGAAANAALLRLLGGAGDSGGSARSEADAGGAEPGTAASGGAERRGVTGALVCRYCGGDSFEVAADECFCEGCCLPLDVQDDQGCGGADPVVLELRSPAAPAPGAGGSMVTCPSGHDLFQVAAAYTLGPDGHVRRLSVGLRCPVDGALTLLVDDARAAPAVARRTGA